MSKSLNHEKLYRRDLVQQSYEPTPIFKKSGWLPIGFGEHKGKTMPTMLFTATQDLSLLKENDDANCRTGYGRELNRQARVVWNRAERLVAPLRYGAKTQFVVIADINDVFERVVLTPKIGCPEIRLAEGSRIVKCSRELAVSIVCEFDNETLGYKRMGRSLRQMFTFKNPEWTRAQQYERFVQNDDNVDVSSIKLGAYL
jgi:hypothetical protein